MKCLLNFFVISKSCHENENVFLNIFGNIHLFTKIKIYGNGTLINVHINQITIFNNFIIEY